MAEVRPTAPALILTPAQGRSRGPPHEWDLRTFDFDEMTKSNCGRFSGTCVPYIEKRRVQNEAIELSLASLFTVTTVRWQDSELC